MSQIAEEACTLDIFQERIEAVDAACCSGDGSCPDGDWAAALSRAQNKTCPFLG